ncbi:RNA polymerase-associated protein RapA [subsurface metagenome]
MARTKEDKKKARRKIKKKEGRYKLARALEREKADYLFYEALWFRDAGNLDKALGHMEKAVLLDPKNEEFLTEMACLGYDMKRADVELKALLALYNNGLIKPDQMPILCQLLVKNGKYEQTLSLIEETLPLIPKIKGPNRKTLKKHLIETQKYCLAQLETGKRLTDIGEIARESQVEPHKITTPSQEANVSEAYTERRPLPEIPVSIEVNPLAFKKAWPDGHFSSLENFELTLEAYQIRFKETFENLICLHNLKDVRSFWYQEETARKVLKAFRGRALLADEVGLGKTIEALMILKEYIQRGMVKNALILTPTPLVGQWKEELKNKFGLDFPSTDDPDYRTMESSFWDGSFILASINIAKSKRNFPLVTKREYDMVIVDEAHHLKNRSTFNWKLVNALKKRFLLLLTATPIENNLMELYNLVTLLKRLVMLS